MCLKLFIFVIISIDQVFTLQEKTAVLILARGGSKGVRLKNLQIVGGISLLGRSILTAKNAGIDDITVSTDHPLIALEAVRYNVSVFKRCSTTSSDWAPSMWGVLDFLERRQDITTLALLQVTSPFVQAKHLRYSLIKLNQPTPFDCVFSVTRSYKLRWDCDDIYPLNFDISKRPRRQDWKGEFIETGAFYIARTPLLRRGYLQNGNCTVWEVTAEESLEIDIEFDIILANNLIKRN